MRGFPGDLARRLAERRDADAYRSLRPRAGIDFASNDYLAFAQAPELRAVALGDLPSGAGGSRLLRGQLEIFEALEARLAQWCGTEAALFFPSGYQANVALLSALLGPEDHVFSDELNHASLIDGMRLGRGRRHVYPHADVGRLRAMLADTPPAGMRFIVTESLFSMDGDIAPLAELAGVAEAAGAYLIVDEAHATGLWGSGIVAREGLRSRVFATIHTGGKALGCAGAWIAGAGTLREYLVNFARPFIFSTAPFPPVAAALLRALDHWEGVGPARAERVLGRARDFRARLARRHGVGFSAAVDGPITPLIVGAGTNREALRAADGLQAAGLDVRAIRPPTVPDGTARLRITFHHALRDGDIARLETALGEVLGAAGAR